MPQRDITDLTICRGAFAAWVFAYHVDLYLNFSAALGPFAGLIRRGYLGVDGFFLLSGLILARTYPNLGRNPRDILKFWGRRLARVYPVHLVTLALFGAVLATGLAHGLAPRDPRRFAGAALVQNILLVQGWDVSTIGPWNYPSWSVSTEWAGYLLFPLLSALVAYFDMYVAFQIVIAGFVLLGLLASRHHNLNLTFAEGLLRFFPEFLIGMASARLVPLLADAAPIARLLALGLAFLAFGASLGVDLVAVAGLWLVLFCLTMRADAQRPPMLGQSAALQTCGRLSYAVYMSFGLAELLVTQWFRRSGWTPVSHAALFAGTMLAITGALATLLHVAVEVPARQAVDNSLLFVNKK
jgi:peptidoglycan/LPS O-acetylase OafA/YrhL